MRLAENVFHTKTEKKKNSGVQREESQGDKWANRKQTPSSSWTSLMRPLLASIRMEKCVCVCACTWVCARLSECMSVCRDWGSEKLSYVLQSFQIGLRDDATTQVHLSPLFCVHSWYVCVSACVCVWKTATLPFWPKWQGASAIVAWLGLPFKLSGISNCGALCGELPPHFPPRYTPLTTTVRLNETQLLPPRSPRVSQSQRETETPSEWPLRGERDRKREQEGGENHKPSLSRESSERSLFLEKYKCFYLMPAHN